MLAVDHSALLPFAATWDMGIRRTGCSLVAVQVYPQILASV